MKEKGKMTHSVRLCSFTLEVETRQTQTRHGCRKNNAETSKITSTPGFGSGDGVRSGCNSTRDREEAGNTCHGITVSNSYSLVISHTYDQAQTQTHRENPQKTGTHQLKQACRLKKPTQRHTKSQTNTCPQKPTYTHSQNTHTRP